MKKYPYGKAKESLPMESVSAASGEIDEKILHNNVLLKGKTINEVLKSHFIDAMNERLICLN